MNGFCAGLVLTVGGDRFSGIFVCGFSFIPFVLFPMVKGGLFLYLFIILAFEFILTVSACFFLFNLGICFSSLFCPFLVYLPNGGRILSLFFFRHIGVFGFFFVCLFSFPFSHLLFRAGSVHFHRSRVRIGSHDFWYFLLYIYIFEIYFLSKPLLIHPHVKI